MRHYHSQLYTPLMRYMPLYAAYAQRLLIAMPFHAADH